MNLYLHPRHLLLPTRYVHAVFTLPRELDPLALQNKRLIYNLLFHASAQTLLEIARDPRHLGAEIAFFSVLHSWNQRLQFHPHVHCVLAAGGLAPDHSRWISARRSFFLPIGVFSRHLRSVRHDLSNDGRRGNLWLGAGKLTVRVEVESEAGVEPR